MQPVRLSLSIVVVAALSLLCSRPLLTQDASGGSDPMGRGHSGQGAGGLGQGGPGGTGGAAPLDPSVKRTPVQAGKATGFLYQPAAPGEKAGIGVFVMHFGSDYSNFSACSELSRRGYTVLCTKNSGGGLNDILPDARSSVEYLRSVGGVRKVVLWGHSGGATLMTAYQLMAENGVKACQGPEKITKCPESLAGMPVADGMILADANWGNAVMTLLSIDPAVIDEGDPAKLDEDLNLFSRKNGFNAGGNSSYSPEFIKKWQSAVGRRNNAIIKSMLEKVAALGPESTDDPRVVVYGANSIGPNNKLFPQDVKLMAHTVKPWPLIHADGSVTTRIVYSVRVPSGRPSSPQNGALNTTARRYLVDNAVRGDRRLRVRREFDVRGRVGVLLRQRAGQRRADPYPLAVRGHDRRLRVSRGRDHLRTLRRQGQVPGVRGRRQSRLWRVQAVRNDTGPVRRYHQDPVQLRRQVAQPEGSLLTMRAVKDTGDVPWHRRSTSKGSCAS